MSGGRRGPREDYERQALASIDNALTCRRRHRRDHLLTAVTYALLARTPAPPAWQDLPSLPADNEYEPSSARFARLDEIKARLRDSLYDRLKQSEGIAAIVSDLYRRIQADPGLSPWFEGVEVWQVQRHMVAYLVQATGGPRNYSGRSLAVAHERLNVTDRAFGRLGEHLAEALHQAGVSPADVLAVMDRIAPLREQIVTQRLSDPSGRPAQA